MTQQEFQTRYTYHPVTDKLGEGGLGNPPNQGKWCKMLGSFGIKIEKMSLTYGAYK